MQPLHFLTSCGCARNVFCMARHGVPARFPCPPALRRLERHHGRERRIGGYGVRARLILDRQPVQRHRRRDPCRS